MKPPVKYSTKRLIVINPPALDSKSQYDGADEYCDKSQSKYRITTDETIKSKSRNSIFLRDFNQSDIFNLPNDIKNIFPCISSGEDISEQNIDLIRAYMNEMKNNLIQAYKGGCIIVFPAIFTESEINSLRESSGYETRLLAESSLFKTELFNELNSIYEAGMPPIVPENVEEAMQLYCNNLDIITAKYNNMYKSNSVNNAQNNRQNITNQQQNTDNVSNDAINSGQNTYQNIDFKADIPQTIPQVSQPISQSTSQPIIAPEQESQTSPLKTDNKTPDNSGELDLLEALARLSVVDKQPIAETKATITPQANGVTNASQQKFVPEIPPKTNRPRYNDDNIPQYQNVQPIRHGQYNPNQLSHVLKPIPESPNAQSADDSSLSWKSEQNLIPRKRAKINKRETIPESGFYANNAKNTNMPISAARAVPTKMYAYGIKDKQTDWDISHNHDEALALRPNKIANMRIRIANKRKMRKLSHSSKISNLSKPAIPTPEIKDVAPNAIESEDDSMFMPIFRPRTKLNNAINSGDDTLYNKEVFRYNGTSADIFYGGKERRKLNDKAYDILLSAVGIVADKEPTLDKSVIENIGRAFISTMQEYSCSPNHIRDVGKNAGFYAWHKNDDFQKALFESMNKNKIDIDKFDGGKNKIMQICKDISAAMQKESYNSLRTERGRHNKKGMGARSYRTARAIEVECYLNNSDKHDIFCRVD